MSTANSRFSLADISSTPIEPQPIPSRQEQDIADEISKQQGFIDNRAPRAPLKRQRSAEPKRQITIQLPISYADRLVSYCDRERYTYPLLLMKLMDDANI